MLSLLQSAKNFSRSSSVSSISLGSIVSLGSKWTFNAAYATAAKKVASKTPAKNTKTALIKQRTDKAKRAEAEREKLKLQKQRLSDKAAREKEKSKQAREKQKERDAKTKEITKREAIKEKEREKKRIAKEEKDAKPKRSLSAFSYYLKTKIHTLKEENSDMHVTQIMKQAAEDWKALPESEKKSYIAESAKDKKRYEAEKKEAAKKAPPKRPLTAYLIFMNDIRPQILKEKPNLTITEQAKAGGKKWKALSEGDKQKYKAKAEKLVEEYKKKYASFVQKKA